MTATPPKSDEFRIERSKVIAAAPPTLSQTLAPRKK